MGLDVTAYRKIVPYEGRFNGHEPADDRAFELRPNQHFVAQADGLDGWYIATAGMVHVGMGPYSAYDRWRERLWVLSSEMPDDPFGRLVNFSDCEGVIGNRTSASLLAEFARHRHLACRIAQDESSDFLYAYDGFLAAFAVAAFGGAVKFH
jgi:hypothetical protein